MNGRVREEYSFACPGCEASLTVNDPMKDALIERGCVLCGTSLTAEAFTSLSAVDVS